MKKNVTRALLLILALTLLLGFAACTPADEKQTDTADGTETTVQTEIQETETENPNLILGEDVAYAADFTVSGVFGDNMVLQRNEYIRLWGWAEESENGKKVSASFMGMTADALIENGAWELVFKCQLPANTEGNELKVYTDKKEISFKDVLVGDVFMIIGQSNVQQSVGGHLEYPAAAEKWDLDDLDKTAMIRMNYNSNTDSEGYPTRGTTDVCPDVVTKNGWVIPDEENILRLSAMGYFTALEITKLTENKIPVGMVQFSANGRPLSVFMPNHLADEYGSDHFDTAQGVYIGNYHSSVVTRYMYNHYIYPYERMPIAGIVWCQGEPESNYKLSGVYVERFTALMTYMRSTHNLVDPDFPVFVVEFPSIYPDPGNSEKEWNYLNTGRIRAVQGTISMSLEGSYTISCSDLWNDKVHWNNVHPYVKIEQGQRIAAQMGVVIYGEDKTMDQVSGPILESWELSSNGKTITLKFKNCGEGLTTSDGGTVVKGLAGLGKKNDIYDVADLTAEITGPDTITITSNRALNGVAYHYEPAFFYGEDINLCNSYGIPAVAFWVYDGPMS